MFETSEREGQAEYAHRKAFRPISRALTDRKEKSQGTPSLMRVSKSKKPNPKDPCGPLLVPIRPSRDRRRKTSGGINKKIVFFVLPL